MGDATKILGCPMDPRGTTRFLLQLWQTVLTPCATLESKMYPQSLGQPQNTPTASETCSITLKTPQETLLRCSHSPQTLLGLPQSCYPRLSEVFFRIRAPSAQEVAPRT